MNSYIKKTLSVVIAWILFMGVIYLDYNLTGEVLYNSFYMAGFAGFVICIGIVFFIDQSVSKKIKNDGNA